MSYTPPAPPPDGRIRFELKETLTLVITIAFGLGGFASSDPWIVYPCLAVAGAAGTIMSLRLHAKTPAKAVLSILVWGVLAAFAWRKFHTSDSSAQLQHSPQSSANTPRGVIVQKAKESTCSNVVSGGTVSQECQSNDKTDKP